MTRNEFAESYASRSDMSVAQLLQLGLRFVECNCDYEGCEGWQARMPGSDLNVTTKQWETAERWAEQYLSN